MAEVKRNHDEYQASRNGGQNFAAVKESPKSAPKTEVQTDTDDDDDEDWPFQFSNRQLNRQGRD